jgi:hypothetical protein
MPILCRNVHVIYSMFIIIIIIILCLVGHETRSVRRILVIPRTEKRKQ